MTISKWLTGNISGYHLDSATTMVIKFLNKHWPELEYKLNDASLDLKYLASYFLKRKDRRRFCFTRIVLFKILGPSEDLEISLTSNKIAHQISFSNQTRQNLDNGQKRSLFTMSKHFSELCQVSRAYVHNRYYYSRYNYWQTPICSTL
jgi:hypothetical protein